MSRNSLAIIFLSMTLIPGCRSTEEKHSDLAIRCFPPALREDSAYTRLRALFLMRLNIETKRKETHCCAIEPFDSMVIKDLPPEEQKELRDRLLRIIDEMEKGRDAEQRSKLRKEEGCYGPMMDLFYDFRPVRPANL